MAERSTSLLSLGEEMMAKTSEESSLKDLSQSLKIDVLEQSSRVLLTKQEHEFLDSVLKHGDEGELGKVSAKLRDGTLFAKKDDFETESSKLKRRYSSVKREKYLSERQKAHLHDNLWEVHKDRVENTPASKWRKGVRRIIALRGLGNGSEGFLKALKASTESKGDNDEDRTESRDEGRDEQKDHADAGDAFSQSFKNLMTYAASIHFYGGEGIEIGHSDKIEKKESVEDFEAMKVRPASSANYDGQGFEIGDLSKDDDDAVEEEKEENKVDLSQSTKHSAWDVLKNKSGDENDFDTIPLLILGTAADDDSCNPHVMSPPLMEKLRSFFPFACREDNYWLKYSLVRDGSSIFSFMKHARGSKHTVCAIETVDGEVFGSFTAVPWRKTHSYFGNGQSFLWRMKKPRTTPCSSVEDQAALESDVEIFNWTGRNEMFQILTSDKIAMGGGGDDGSSFGFMVEDDLLMGSSGHCETFDNPCLSPLAVDGMFEVANMEVWAITPFMFEKDARKSELSLIFIEENQL